MQLTTKDFILKAKQVHGDRFDYAKTIYVKAVEKVTITCNICSSDFTQKPSNHMQGQGCPNCSHNKTSTREEVLSLIPSVYTVVFNSSTKRNDTVTIYCPKHDHYTTRTISHLKQRKTFCSICAEDIANKKTVDKAGKEFITTAVKVHGGRYDYSNVVYTSMTDKVKIKCNVCNTLFEQIPHNHKRGTGCPVCASDMHGWGKTRFKSKPTVLYVIKVKNVYKIGITTRTVEKRYKLEHADYSIIFQATFLDGGTAWDLEKKLLANYRQYKYTGPRLLKTASNKEIVTYIAINEIQQIIKDYYAIL